MNPKVDAYLSERKTWQAELTELRRIVLECPVNEELKWGVPCYTFGKSNLILLGGFKEYCALTFCKGALLKDAQGILLKPGENTQAARLIRFTSVREVTALESILKAYIREAIAAEKAGLKVAFKDNTELTFPQELLDKLAENPALKAAFEALTPGRQRAYNLYFSAPKQSQSRTSRIEKYAPRILAGKGFYDCVCGLSKKMPSCDGSHKLAR
ncbi:MAG TPA: DUF1801 domain-containing protein [Candidatus Limnocylindria bacterium]|jgi:uncharacterized protein YdeI (YjbR/CyaY-like superfamily)|nr:DUF1801 domain-containing protein [Candidatus Limnocylindria bacterium]